MVTAVFAPTNAAFADVPEALLYYLLQDIDALTAVLTYHVVNGKVLSSGLTDGQEVASLEGGILPISISMGVVMVDGATVVIPNIDASNGVVHAIDKVLVPSDLVLPTLVDVAVADPDNFSTLVAAVTDAALGATLSGPGPFTLFAPTNAGFDMLPAGTVAGLLADEDKTPLKDILLYHVVNKLITAKEILDGDITTAETVEGSILTFSVTDGTVMVNGTPVLSTAVASNGIAHVIGEVLIPPVTPSMAPSMEEDGAVSTSIFIAAFVSSATLFML
jgi:transforming growth factor-beta-induced protein